MSVFIIKRSGAQLSEDEKSLIRDVVKGKGRINVINVADNISLSEQEEISLKISSQKIREKVIIVMFTYPPILLARLTVCASTSLMCELYLVVDDSGSLKLVSI